MRALVTRPRDEAEALATLLARRGVEAIVEPLIEIADTDAALRDLAGVQAVLCTSANGVRALARASAERGMPVCAVGDRTAQAARDAGFSRIASAGGDVADLAALVRRRLRPGAGRLLHVAGSVVAGDLTAMLGGDGFVVERAVLYEARPAAALRPATVRLIDAGKIDLALFFSPRTAAIFARLAAEAGVAAGLSATVALSISRAADTGLAGLPFRDRLVAGQPTQAALLAAVDGFVGQPA